ncbi:MAG: hypothetical protein ACLRT5_09450 [Lachnospiraceae bacterium]
MLLEEEEASAEQDQSLDSYDRLFLRGQAWPSARESFTQGDGRHDSWESTMTEDRRLQEMLRRYFEPGGLFSCSGTG